MPRASDVDRDMTNGERVEVKYVSYSFAVSELTLIEFLVHRLTNLRRLSFPLSSVCAVGYKQGMANNQSSQFGWPAPSPLSSTTVRRHRLTWTWADKQNTSSPHWTSLTPSSLLPGIWPFPYVPAPQHEPNWLAGRCYPGPTAYDNLGRWCQGHRAQCKLLRNYEWAELIS
jgi:hypothetical protein